MPKKIMKKIDMLSIKQQIEEQLKSGAIKPEHAPAIQQREILKQKLKQTFNESKKEIPHNGGWIQTGIHGFDELLDKGIPKGLSVLVCGGPGSGKTIFCLQTMAAAAAKGEKCLYMTFEESPERLINHMKDFGWDADAMIKEGNLIIKRFDIFDVTRQVEAMLEEAKGELLIDVKQMLFPANFKPQRIVLDSLSAISAAFVGKQETYRIYIEQLFRMFEEIGATSFLISETSELPKKLTSSGVEEFLADGVIVIYNIQHGNVRESAIECLKMRGASFQKKIAAMQIESGKGIVVYPEQEVFSAI